MKLIKIGNIIINVDNVVAFRYILNDKNELFSIVIDTIHQKNAYAIRETERLEILDGWLSRNAEDITPWRKGVSKESNNNS